MPRRLLAIAVVLFAAAGCFPTAQPEAPYSDPMLEHGRQEISRIQLETQAALDRADTERNSLLVLPICDPVKLPQIKTCGLIADEVLTPQFIAEFMRDVCHENEKSTISDGCANRVFQMIGARFRERYTQTDTGKVELFCTAHPKECGSIKFVELQWLQSHDDRIFALVAARRDAIFAEQRERNQAVIQRYRLAVDERQRAQILEEQARRERAAAVLGAIGAGLKSYGEGMQRQPVNCTSQTIGTTTFSNCR